MVPKGWGNFMLSEICSKPISYGIVQTGNNLPKGIPCLRVIDLTKNYVNLDDTIKTSLDIHQAYKKTILEEGDIVLALRGEVGLAHLIDESLSGINITRGLARIAADRSRIVPDFLLWALRSTKFRTDLMRRVGGSALQEISLSELRKVEILVPPLSEQKKIAKILSTWDKAITITEQLLTKNQQQKKALMQQLLTGKKRFSEFKGDWKYVELGSLLGYKQPTPYLVKSTDYNDDYETPVLTAGKTFVLGYTNEAEGIYKDKLPVIIFDDFTTDSKFVDFPFKAKSSAMKILTARDGVSIKYVFEAMQMLDFTIGGHQRHWISIFSNLKIAIPEIAEQQKIALVLSTADSEIKTLKKQLNRLEQEKKALMQQLFTGKRRVQTEAA
jgi:type I restriction enzyme S subunit